MPCEGPEYCWMEGMYKDFFFFMYEVEGGLKEGGEMEEEVSQKRWG